MDENASAADRFRRLPLLTSTVALAALALGLSGCITMSSGEPKFEVQTVNRVISPDGYSVLASGSSGNGNSMQAGLNGELVLGPGNCIQVLDDTGEAQAVVFPKGTSIVTGPVPGLEVEGKKFAIGDTVGFGGGFMTLSSKARTEAGSCAGDRQPFIVHTVE